MKFDEIFPVLNRPEYPKNPEAFQSALAWSLVDFAPVVDDKEVTEGNGGNSSSFNKPLGLIYKKITASRARQIRLQETRPTEADLTSFAGRLLAAGLLPEEALEIENVAQSLLDALEGVKPDKAKGVAATPLTRSIAYLQNPVGVHTKANPPNFARIIEQVYSAGDRKSEVGKSAALSWYKAITASGGQALESTIEKAFASHLASPPLPDLESVDLAGLFDLQVQPDWLRNSDTPFKWFHSTWSDFCQDSWRNSLPSRRWSDWASCILRTGISLAFLWECRFYRNLGRILLKDEIDGPEARDSLLSGAGPLLEWHEPGTSLTVKDQGPTIRTTIRDGTSIRTYLREDSDLLERLGGNASDIARWQSIEGFGEFITALHGLVDEDARNEIAGRFGQQPSAAKNTIETVQYSLLSRKESGRQADFYGVLARRSRRFVVVEPGEEWIVVIASMCARQPGGTAVLKAVRSALRDLGIGVDRQTLVGELERAGLTASSHDADDAIEVWAGF